MDEEISEAIQNVLKLPSAIAPKLFESDKWFIARSIEDNQGFLFGF